MTNQQMSSEHYGMGDVEHLLRRFLATPTPRSVVMTPTRMQQYFCSDLLVAGRVIQEMGFHETVEGHRVPDCMMLPFIPMEYRGDIGTLEMVMQSCEETVLQARYSQNCVGWCVFWDWSVTFPEYEYTLYTDNIYPE